MLRLFNSLTRKIEEFKPINTHCVGMYTCGPTVYSFASIGNFRTYTSADLLVRTLKANGYTVDYVMNITDVGHLTGDNLGDADTGEDRLEKAAKSENKTAWDIAKFYTEVFWQDYKKLNLTEPEVWAKATDHIQEQVDLVRRLEDGGFTYKTSDGIYFDTKVYEEKTGNKYGELSTLDEIKEGARVEVNPEKHNATDFALWKFSPKDEKRQMEWDSPWGVGFPGWHIECSAMSMKYLGESFDIHTGGEDLRQTHHPNEIAQSEAATGKKFVNYWLHGAHLQVDGGRMGKSLGNAYTISDLEKKGFDPLALRYLYMTGHYRDPLNFTWESLQAVQNALNNLRETVREWTVPNVIASDKRGDLTKNTVVASSPTQNDNTYYQRFLYALNNDLGTPQALALMWEMVKSDLEDEKKAEILLKMDIVLGLKLDEYVGKKIEIPEEVQKLVAEREEARKQKNFIKSDELREKIYDLGFEVKDTSAGTKLTKA